MSLRGQELRRPAVQLFLLFLFFAAGISIAGYYFFSKIRENIENNKREELIGIARTKVKQIVDWRTERQAEGKFFLNNQAFIKPASRLIKHATDSLSRAEVRFWLSPIQGNHDYSAIMLIDKEGTIRLNVGSPHGELERRSSGLLTKAEQQRTGVLSDLHFSTTRNAWKDIHIDMAVPLFLISGNDSVLLGFLFFVIDPHSLLYPLIMRWPQQTSTAEALIVRREGDDVLFLNDLRHKRNTALSMHMKLDNASVPEVQAALGKEGLVEGRDYRGNEVVAAIQKVPGTPWVLLAKIDEEEIYAPERSQGLVVLVIVALTLLAGGMGVLFLWRHRETQYLRKMIELETARKVLVKHFDHFFRLANDIILLVDQDLNVVEANERAVRTYGYSREQLLLLKLTDIRDPETYDDTPFLLEQIEERGGVLRETRHRRKDGTTFPVEISAQVITIEGKKYFQGIIRDISERKEAEKKTSHLTRVYAVLSNINQAILRTHDREVLFQEACRIAVEDGKFMMSWIGVVNHEHKKVDVVASFGATSGYIENLNISIEQVPEGLGPAGTCVRNRQPEVLNDIPHDERFAPWRSDAMRMGFQSVASFPLLVNETVYGVFSMYSRETNFFDEKEVSLLSELASDVSLAIQFQEEESKRRQTEEQLAQSEQKFKLIFENVNDGIVLLEGERFSDCNPMAERLFGLSRHDLIGKAPYELSPLKQPDGGDSNARVNELLIKAHEEGPQFFEWRHLRSDSTTFDVEIGIARIHLAGKALFLGVMRDVTERKILEQQLRQAQKLEGIGTLAGGVAHDFNNILAIILGHCSLLREVGANDLRLSKSIGAIETSVHRGANLVEQILMFARKSEVVFKPVDINYSVLEMIKMMDETFPKTINVSHHLSDHLPTLQGDKTQIHQVLLNLCVNARDAMPHGGTLRIETEEVDAISFIQKFPGASAGAYVHLSIADTGIGIDDGVRQKMFEPFFTTKEKGKGTGLGLAVVYGIMENHHGIIDVSSNIGAGATFHLYFPASLGKENGQDEIAGVAENAKGGNETILLVEDEELLRDLTQALLESNGYHVLVARDGMEAVRIYEKEPMKIALIISDLGLPKIGGEDVISRIRTINPNARVILSSGFIDPVARKHLVQLGVSSIVQKPYTPNALLSAVRQALDELS